MKKSGYIITLALAIIFSLSFYRAQSWAGERIYQMSGEVAAIDLGHNTAVVEIPLAGKMLTVGGPLSSKAVLKRGGQSVGLSDFQVGDRVIVKWEVTEQGHVILSLNAK